MIKSPLLHTFKLNQIDSFLVKNGWSCDSVIEGIVNIYHHLSFTDEEIVVPLTENIKGYDQLVSTIIENLQRIYNSRLEKVINGINGLTEDMVQIRLVHEDVKNGTIQLDDGVKMINGARELMSSAANSVIQKRRLYLGKMHSQASEYVNHLRLGQTEVGSYIINIYSEIRENVVPELFESTPFDRKVTKQVIESIRTTQEVIKEYSINNRIEVFQEAVPNGISANLLKSLIDLSGTSKQRDIQMDIGIINSIQYSDEIFNFYIESNEIKSIEIGYNYLIEKNELDGIELSGFVFKLSRDEDEEAGVINIATTYQDKTRKVRVYLNEQQYEIAITAHRDQKSVIIKGDLSIETRKAVMTNVQSILIL